MKKAHTVEFDVSLAAVGQDKGRNCFGAFASAMDARNWIADQGGMAEKNVVVKCSWVADDVPLTTWPRRAPPTDPLLLGKPFDSNPPSADDCFVVNLSHHKQEDRYITFWRPEDCGYAWPLAWAGRYRREDVIKSQGYYNSGYGNIAIPCHAVASMLEDPEPGMIDNNAGPVVRNTKENWLQILAAVVVEPGERPWPLWPGRRERTQRQAAKDYEESKQRAAQRERGG